MKKRSGRAGSGGSSSAVIWVLSLGLLASVVISILMFANIVKWASNDEAYLVRTGEQRVMAQEIAKNSISAATGNRKAFAELREARDSFELTLEELKSGVNEINLPASPEPVMDD